jgi:hypothetical protein
MGRIVCTDHRMAHEEQRNTSPLLLSFAQSPAQIRSLVCRVCFPIAAPRRAFIVQCGPPKATHVEGKNGDTLLGIDREDMFIPTDVLDEAVGEDERGAGATGVRQV